MFILIGYVMRALQHVESSSAGLFSANWALVGGSRGSRDSIAFTM